jgi:hypothetical protein
MLKTKLSKSYFMDSESNATSSSKPLIQEAQNPSLEVLTTDVLKTAYIIQLHLKPQPGI